MFSIVLMILLMIWIIW